MKNKIEKPHLKNNISGAGSAKDRKHPILHYDRKGYTEEIYFINKGGNKEYDKKD